MAVESTYIDLVAVLNNKDNIAKNSFDILKSISTFINNTDNDFEINELVLRSLEQREYFGEASIILDSLIRSVGLFPYLDYESLSFRDTISYECHRPFNMNEDDIVFHRVQAEVYRSLLSGENVILSAPTSFGKSLIIDAMIASTKYNNIVIIVPTLALIDETRVRLTNRFRDNYKIITHTSQSPANKNIYVLTQERFMELNDVGKVDFFVIDEFYKLSPRDSGYDERCVLLNQAFYRLLKTKAQFYLLGPNIENIAFGVEEKIKYKFIRTDYVTVASEVHYLYEGVKKFNREEELVKLARSVSEPTLIFCGSPARARTVGRLLLENEIHLPPFLAPVRKLGFSPSWS